jgi:hypothetical protein
LVGSFSGGPAAMNNPAQLQWVLTGFALTRLGQPAEAR